MWRWRSAVWHVLHVIYLASVKRCRSYRLSWRRPIDRSGVLRCSLITRTPMSENSSVLSPASTSWAGQNILISSRLRGTHCTTLHLNYTHKYSASDVLPAQYCVHVRARAPRPRFPSAACPPTKPVPLCAPRRERVECARDGRLARRRARTSLCGASKVACQQGMRRGAGRGAARRAARALRRRAGGAAASGHLRASVGTPSSALARPRPCALPAERARREQNRLRRGGEGGMRARGGHGGGPGGVGSRLRGARCERI